MTAPLLLVLVAHAAAQSEPPPRMFALLIGSNAVEQRAQTPLQFADDDVRTLGGLLRSAVPDARVEVLTEGADDAVALARPTREGVQSAALRLAADVQTARVNGEATALVLVYAGHGALTENGVRFALADGALDGREFAEIVDTIGADVSHVVLDACHALDALQARGPGGKAMPVEIGSRLSLLQRDDVGVIVSTTTSSVSLESSVLGAGVFSFLLRSGLLGGADVNHDERISYDEIEAFLDVATRSFTDEATRPRFIVKRPSGHHDLVHLAGSAARRVVVRGGGRRVITVDERPLVLVHAEPGHSVTLHVPPTVNVRGLEGDGSGDGDELVWDAWHLQLSGQSFGPRAFALRVRSGTMVARTGATPVPEPTAGRDWKRTAAYALAGLGAQAIAGGGGLMFLAGVAGGVMYVSTSSQRSETQAGLGRSQAPLPQRPALEQDAMPRVEWSR